MIMKYRYFGHRVRMGRGEWFQCDTEDFKKLWNNRKFQEDMHSCVVRIGKKIYDYSREEGWREMHDCSLYK